MTAPALPSAASVSELMTAEEWNLYSTPAKWREHGASAAAERGALFLDRTMPGWQHRVTLKDLDLADTCRCVLGQLFVSLERTADNPDGYVSGFSAGREMMGFDVVSIEYDAADWTPEEFFGFDHFGAVSYNSLTEAWCDVIAERL